MSEPTNINKGIVSTLGGTDLIVGVDPGGAILKPITLDNLLALVRSNIKVGGRNLAINSGTNMVATTGVSSRKLSMPLVVGEQYTVSFDIDYGETKPYFEIYLSESVGQSFTYRNVIERGNVNNGHNVFVKKITKPASVFALFTSSGQPITISNLKVERGNVATDWTPAPEDLGWGGVNQRFTISYDLPLAIGQKGGSHEPADNVCLHLCLSSHSHLSFRSLDDMCRFIGKSCEELSVSADSAGSDLRGCRHSHTGLDAVRCQYAQPSRVQRSGELHPHAILRQLGKDAVFLSMEQFTADLRPSAHIRNVERQVDALVSDCLSDNRVATPGKEVTL